MMESQLIDQLKANSRKVGALTERRRIVGVLYTAFRTNPEAMYNIEGIMSLLFGLNWDKEI